MNPILQGMKNNRLHDIIRAVKGDPQGMYDYMMRTNPQFAQFVTDNKGKSPEQIAQEHGIDFNAIGQYLR